LNFGGTHFDISFNMLWNMVLETFWEFCFEKNLYYLRQPRCTYYVISIRWSYSIRWNRPYGKAVIKSRGLSMGGKLPNWKCFTLCFESREKSYPLDGFAPMEMPPLGGESYQWDGASSRFTHFDIFTKIGFLYFFEVDYFDFILLNPISIFYLDLIISIPFYYAWFLYFL